MQTITAIGFDIAKSVFQVHGVDAGGEVVVRRSTKVPVELLRPLRLGIAFWPRRRLCWGRSEGFRVSRWSL